MERPVEARVIARAAKHVRPLPSNREPVRSSFRSGPSPTSVFEWITLTSSHPLFRLQCFLQLLLARLSPQQARYTTSKAREKGKREAESSAEADVRCPGVQESFNEDIQLRRGEAPVGTVVRSGILAFVIPSVVPVTIPIDWKRVCNSICLYNVPSFRSCYPLLRYIILVPAHYHLY
jgi:hypothetical protein